MGDIIDRSGKPFRPRKGDQNKRHSVLANEAMLNLVARVQNTEAALVMVMTIVHRTLSPSDQEEIDLVMEAFYQAQVQRGATHLARDPEDDNPAIFV